MMATQRAHQSISVVTLSSETMATMPSSLTIGFRIYEPSFTLKKDFVIDRIINERIWDVENQEKWKLEDSDRFNYNITNADERNT
jgi:hypothetical protein